MQLRQNCNYEDAMSSSQENKFQKFLRASGYKFTPERRVILREVFANHDHFDADDILIGLRNRGKRISRATIYRTLAILAQSGLLREVIYGERHSHYEHVYGHKHHDHLVCTSCGRIVEFTDDSIEHFQHEVCKLHNFKPLSHKFEISGLCEACRGNPEASRGQA